MEIPNIVIYITVKRNSCKIRGISLCFIAYLMYKELIFVITRMGKNIAIKRPEV